jgi:tetratricopeptide (TPR) repeat protein
VTRVPAAVLAAGIVLLIASGAATPVTGRTTPIRGLTAAPQVARAYDAVLNADFEQVPTLLVATCGPAPRAACLGIRAMATWWDIQLDPRSTALDARFSPEVDAAVREAERWTRREPERAEAWFYLGVALGARSQWKVLRDEHLSAARDGKRIKDALERALDLDPAMDDAAFGIGVYRYYAAIAPAYLRWIRWLLLLPGGDREGGLAQMERTSRRGQLVRAEADYQLHLVYLWYEQRFSDALSLVLELQSRYPRNPLFRHLEATITDVYFHDHARSLAASEALVDAAGRGEVNRPGIAAVRAQLNIAVQLDQLGARERARLALDTLLAGAPTAPADAVARARELKRAWSAR